MNQPTTDVFRTSCGVTAPLELNVTGPGCATGERRGFEHPFVLVGRHERSGLRLEDGQVSRQHAYLQQFGERVFCVDLGSRTGIRWGGEPHPSGWLRPGQGVQIGPFTLELAKATEGGDWPSDGVADDWNPLQDRTSDPRSLPWVIVEDGNKVLASLCMNRVLMLVGSAPACRIRLRDAGVSRYHCSLLRTPQGVWLIDLLHGTGVCLNGQPLSWALVTEGDRFQVGPYSLRVWYPESPLSLEEIPAGTPARPADYASKSEQQPAQDKGGLEQAATEASVLVSTLQAELDQTRERLRDAEVLKQQLADRQAECDQLREQARALEVQAAEVAGLQSWLEAVEASARDHEVIQGERDRWQTEAQNLQARLAADSADKEQLGRLAADLHAAEVERDRLQAEQQTSRHSAEQTLARVSDLERALTEAEVFRQQLVDSQAECDRLREQARALEVQAAEVAGLQTRLEAVEASARDLEVVQGERDRWQAEAQNLQVRVAANSADQEQLGRLAADLHAAQVERDRLQAEQQTSQNSVDQMLARVSDLERALAEAAVAHETALAASRTHWESERQALEAHLERERQAHHGAVQAATSDSQARIAAERDEWRHRCDAAQQQLAWEGGLFQSQTEQLRQQVGILQAERDRLMAQLAQAESRLRAAEERSPDEAGHAPELPDRRQQAALDQVFVQLSGKQP